MFGYECLYSKSPRSFLFSVVANVGPHGASRSLAVAYRQGNDKDISASSSERVENVVADILALIKIFSDSANRAPLEAERALAEGWYGRSQGDNEAESNERPSIPDRPQPPFVIPDGSQEEEQSQIQPELPWHDDGLSEFPFTTTCLLLALLGNDSDSNTTNRISTRPGDVQLQPLSTLFRADCLEYGLVVLDISDLDSGVKYGIVGFPVRYMAEVSYCPRPRVPLAISPWLRKYFYHMNLEEDPRFLILKNTPIVYAAALDYFWPSKSTTSAKDASTTTPSRLTTSNEPPRNAHMDRAIDNLLILTQDPADLHLDEETIDKFQKLAKFREQLRRRLEEVPHSLGPSSEASGHILRVAYAGQTHLNWVAFRNLAPAVIAAAIVSEELRSASALSLCVDKFKVEGDEGDLSDLAAALAQSKTLKQLCFVQGPDRHSDDASARFFTQIIYPTYAFSTSLRSRKFTSPSTTIFTRPSPVAQIFPVMHMLTLVGHQREDAADADHQNSHYYDMGNTLLDPERFAVRFLSYLRSVGSGSDKAILRFACGEVSSSLTTTNDDKSSPPSVSPGRFAVSPIPTEFFGSNLAASGESRVGARDIHPGSWMLLLNQQGSISSDDDDILLQYSFVRTRPISAEIAHEQQQQQIPGFDSSLVEVVGGLIEFLRETVPGIDVSKYEKRVERVEEDLRTQRASMKSRKSRVRIGVMHESGARKLLTQFL
ncbi:hypothetical protein N7517_000158 [Penicillium concentricum]|uniref:Uncharacterized protein n=1 Tax=Penicillium concentricum TaxID=293559 RepID=A0A9W9SPS2_9EURO|nr:uncharacterized protein N7517_000158 [Penicillium concentricum]KAJ5382247.1 hypothetical protein N7517_000158 [Penicillium concentricum]